jgi:uncharacterized protein YndB with AHSA1/START domain
VSEQLRAGAETDRVTADHPCALRRYVATANRAQAKRDRRGHCRAKADVGRGHTLPAMARTDTASRVIAAPLERVYAAMVDPDALVAWLPPSGMTATFERFDARPGGSYRMVLTYADASAARGKATANSDIVEARFVDIVPGVRVVQAVDFVSDEPGYAGTMTMTWELATVEAGIRVEIRADNVPHGISAEDHAAGLASSLANLAAYLERGNVRTLGAENP